jgi:hypothetical protein
MKQEKSEQEIFYELSCYTQTHTDLLNLIIDSQKYRK